MSSRDLAGRLHRWAMAMQEIDFDVHYRPGRENVIADALARAPATAVRVVDQLTGDAVAASRQRSRQCKVLAERRSHKNVLVRTIGGVIKARMDQGWRTVPPAELRAMAFREAHGRIWAMNLRRPQKLARLKRSFWWPQMQATVASWVAECQDCDSRKVWPKLVVPPLRSVGVGELGDRWAMVLIEEVVLRHSPFRELLIDGAK